MTIRSGNDPGPNNSARAEFSGKFHDLMTKLAKVPKKELMAEIRKEKIKKRKSKAKRKR